MFVGEVVEDAGGGWSDDGEPPAGPVGVVDGDVPGLVRGSAVESLSRAVLVGVARWSSRKRSAKERPSQPDGPWGRVHQELRSRPSLRADGEYRGVAISLRRLEAGCPERPRGWSGFVG